MASRMVGWKWLAIISLTGLLTTAVDVPKSSRRQLPTQRKYCTTSGSSRPSCVWSAAISAAVASSPSIAAAGSPGVRCTSRKMTTDTMKMVGMSDSSRLSTYFFMLFLLSRDGGFASAEALPLATRKAKPQIAPKVAVRKGSRGRSQTSPPQRRNPCTTIQK